MDQVAVTLPWPDKVLSPNSRVHWARKAKATKSARTYALYAFFEAGARKLKIGAPRVEFVFCPPDKRRRDRDNLIASMKAATDGISDALGIDDSRFETSYRMGEPVKGGAVIVTVKGV